MGNGSQAEGETGKAEEDRGAGRVPLKGSASGLVEVLAGSLAGVPRGEELVREAEAFVSNNRAAIERAFADSFKTLEKRLASLFKAWKHTRLDEGDKGEQTDVSESEEEGSRYLEDQT